MSVQELSEILGVTTCTVRRQLTKMQANGLVIRSYGGVMPVSNVPEESFENKLHKSISEKRHMAECARSLIPNGSTIALGSGTSVYALATLLNDINSSVVYTNSMQTADMLAHYPGIEVHICCGILRSRSGTIIGSEAAEFFRSLNVDYAFIGCDAISAEGIVFCDNLAVATVERLILSCAKHKYILCDSTKLGQSAIASITDLKDCEGLITSRSQSTDIYSSMTQIIAP